MTNIEYERTLNKDYLLRDYDDLLIAFTVARIEGPRGNQLLGNTYHNEDYRSAVNCAEAATTADMAAVPAPTFDRVELWDEGDAAMFAALYSKQFCRVLDAGLLYRRGLDLSAVTRTPHSNDSIGFYSGAATASGAWELLGGYADLCGISPTDLAGASVVATTADLPTTAALDADSPSDGHTDSFYALAANEPYAITRYLDECLYHSDTQSYTYRTTWGAWRKLAHALPWTDAQHAAAAVGLDAMPLPTDIDVDSQWAVVDDGDLLYRRSKRTVSSVSGHITTYTREWSPWACAEPCRCQFRASGFFTVHSPNRNIYLRLPWTQMTPCYRTIDEAANELNSLDLALVEHTPDGLFFLLRDKGGSRLLNPWRLADTRSDATIAGQCFTQMHSLGGKTYLAVDLAGRGKTFAADSARPPRWAPTRI